MTQEQKRKADAIETSIQLIGYSSRFLRERLNCHEPILDGFDDDIAKQAIEEQLKRNKEKIAKLQKQFDEL